jgi:hypothetical protein
MSPLHEKHLSKFSESRKYPFLLHTVQTGLGAEIWLPPGKSGSRPGTGYPDHPRELVLPGEKSRNFWILVKILNFSEYSI